MPATARDTTPPWSYTHHARTRVAERGFTQDAINEVLRHPAITYPQPRYGPDRHIMIGAGLAIAVNTATRTVVTVLFQDHERYAATLLSAGVAA